MTTVPYFRPSLDEDEIAAVTSVLRSGWLTTGPHVREFERAFAEAVGAKHAVAVNSGTAALHLAVEALGLTRGAAVLVPTMTFTATAEVVRYLGAIPILVDADPATLHLDLDDARRKIRKLRDGRLLQSVSPSTEVVGILPVHVGGLMMDLAALRRFASEQDVWIVEDATHAFPAAWRPDPTASWSRCGQGTSAVACFSFYANKTITTGEGGMAVTDDDSLAQRIRLMALHGMSRDAWARKDSATWDYRIVEAGFKYNLTDVAAVLGIHQLGKAERFRRLRQEIASAYAEALADVQEIELPGTMEHRIHAWHLFPIRLHLDRLSISRDRFIDELHREGVQCSVHWRPLHLHPYYQDTFGWKSEQFPVATREWLRLVSLPIFPAMTGEERRLVIEALKSVCRRFAVTPQRARSDT